MKFSPMETPSEKPMRRNGSKAQRAFTLVEILVVIAIISVLAALGTQGAKIAARKRDYSRVETQLERLKLVIEDYKLRFGTYPPSNPAIYDGGLYNELRGNGILNKPGSSNPARHAKDYLPSLKADEAVVVDPATGLFVPAPPTPLFNVINNVPLPVPEPTRYLVVPALPVSLGVSVNFWNYNSVSPTNTLTGYDLWAEYAERGTLKPIIISNGK